MCASCPPSIYGNDDDAITSPELELVNFARKSKDANFGCEPASHFEQKR